MRSKALLLLAASFMASAALAASDKPIMAPAPDWVKPVSVPARPETTDEAPVRILLADQQTRLEPGRVTNYIDFAMLIQTPQGLAAGNLSFPWNPETDEFTVHKLMIRRADGETVDVLAAGQTFTVVRREPNLESALLDGVLTANIQPEGLQVGDVLEYAVTVSSSDPVLKGHVEQMGAGWNGLPFARTHLSVDWPSSLAVQVRQNGALPQIKPVKAGDRMRLDLAMENIEPIIPPRLAPARYAMGRAVEVSDFRSWADLGALLAPLYATAATIPAEGPLRAELEKIKAASADPVKRAEGALALVQDRVRYVALLMGVGGLTPAKAEESWARRYGDCKAKTALLLALLHEMGIAAEPVAVNILLGDGLNERLPMVGLFNHVLVRAQINGRDYWLDGTRTGDTSLARLRTPDFGWGLPLVAKNAALVRMQPAPLDQPESDLSIEIDARAGLTVPAPFKAAMVLRGDAATGTKISLGGMTASAREEALRNFWREQFSFIEVETVDAVFDAETGEQRMSVTGKAEMDWDSGWYETDKTGVGFTADFVRPAGPGQDAPYAVTYPTYARTVETILLPPGFPSGEPVPKAAVDETVAGIAYHREARLVDGVFRIERSQRAVAPEFPASEAVAAQKRLRELADARVYLRRPDNYRPTETEMAAVLKAKPNSAQAFIDRGNLLLNAGRFADSLTDFSDALDLEPGNVWALANRGLAYVYLQDFDAAQKDLASAEAIDSRNFVLWNARGLMAERKDDLSGAIAAYSKVLAVAPDNIWALNRRAAAYYAHRDHDAALADTDALLRTKSPDPDIRLLRANIFKRTGRVDAALAEAKQVSQDNPENSYAQVAAARIYGSFDRKEEALAAFDRAIAIKPEAYIYFNRALTLPEEDVAGRLADLDKALALEPAMPLALREKAALLVKQGNTDAAIALFSDALATEPDNADLLFERGMVYAEAGDAQRAAQDFDLARGKARDAESLNNFCYGKATHGVALESALADCDAALARQPDSAAFLDSKALVLLRLNRIDEALALFDRAVTLLPRVPDLRFGRALTWSRKGDADKAKADQAIALDLDPDVEKRFAGYGLTL
ncbi:MAG TPA: tetratricopeptide repeat protein [Sphingobium sp.]|nr:tetratricopeptide repeat protein [Sphingobium sp.]